MEAQDVFFTLGSVYLGLGIIVLLVILFSIIYVLRKLNKIHDNVSRRIEQELMEIKDKPRLLAQYVGHIIAKGIKNKFTKE